MKKALSLLLCAAMLFGLGVSALAAGADDGIITGEYKYLASLGFIVKGDPTAQFTYSDAYFTHSGYEYDHELCRMTMDFVNASGSSSDVGWEQADRNFDDLITKCGFGNIYTSYYETHTPTADSLGMILASKKLGDYTLLALGLRGHGYGGEWGSDLTVGKTGDHQGFAEARDQALAFLKEYIAKYDITGPVKIWTGGYSRSAITANLVGGALDQGFDLGNGVTFDPNDLYCYTFEAPQATADKNCRDPLYYNIHNIVNHNDLVPLVSFSEWGHSRYGIDYWLPSRQYDGDYYYTLEKKVDALLSETKLSNIAGLPLNIIDDFRYITLNPFDAAAKRSVTQIEFFSELSNALLTYMSPSREYYAENLQADMREVLFDIFSSLSDLPNILSAFGRNFIDMPGLVQLYSSLRSGSRSAFDAAVKTVEDVFMNSLIESGHAQYDGEQLREMLDRLIPLFLNFFMQAPDTALTLLGNLLPILNAHMPEIGTAWLDVTPAEFFLAQNPLLFTDVPRDAYYWNAVRWAYTNGIAKGFDFSSFGPNAHCTRAQVVAYLYRAAGSPAVKGDCPFVDVSENSPFRAAITWAAAEGITAGIDATHFAPNMECSRGQIVTFLYRFSGSPRGNGSCPFADVSPYSPYAKAITWAAAEGIVSGKDAAHFAPDAVCTRAQTVSFLYRCLA